MAFIKSQYPPYWKQFSEYIRFERAGNKCERCGVANGSIVERGYLDESKTFPIWFDGKGGTYCARTGTYIDHFHDYELFIEKSVKIVLTVAHLDGKSAVCFCKRRYGFKCAKPSHVLALCQACHLSEDRAKHIAVQTKNRAKRKDLERGLLNL